VKVKGKKKLRFKYHISNVPVCLPAFCVALGLPADGQRIKRLQTKANEGQSALTWNHDNCGRSGEAGATVRAFLRNYAIKNSQKSPVKPLFSIEQPSLRDLFRLFQLKYPEVTFHPKSFQTLWQRLFKIPFVDPETHALCELVRKKIYSPGFSLCDFCVALKLTIQLARGKAAKADSKSEYREHKDGVFKDREMLNTVKDVCRGSVLDVGATIDRPDHNKFILPTTKNKAAVMAGLMKLKTKITAVEFFRKDRPILFYRSLPDVTTGNPKP
jgi:hypothetical protein